MYCKKKNKYDLGYETGPGCWRVQFYVFRLLNTQNKNTTNLCNNIFYYIYLYIFTVQNAEVCCLCTFKMMKPNDEKYESWDQLNCQTESMSMGWCKKDVSPLLTHWSYAFLALTHQCGNNNTANPSKFVWIHWGPNKMADILQWNFQMHFLQ